MPASLPLSSAGAQIGSGLLGRQVRKLFSTRTQALILSIRVSADVLAILDATNRFAAAVAMLVAWTLMFAAVGPIRQAYLNDLIDSSQRAAVLSFDSLMGSTGAVVAQPVLGRVADISGYFTS